MASKRKKCSMCGRRRAHSSFFKNSRDGLQSRCKTCNRAASTELYRSSRRYRAASCLRNCKATAKRQGVPFSLDIDWLAEKFTAGVCELTGVALDFGPGRGALSPSLDRHTPRRGYTQENCRVIAFHLNTALAEFGEDELAGLCVAFLNYYHRTRGRAACWGLGLAA